jgi:hypothetical protein
MLPPHGIGRRKDSEYDMIARSANPESLQMGGSIGIRGANETTSTVMEIKVARASERELKADQSSRPG